MNNMGSQKSLAGTQRLQTNRKVMRIIVTTCPPGCGNNCKRVFVDTIGLGYKVYCECPICHTDNTKPKRKKVLVDKDDPQPSQQATHSDQPIALGGRL